MAKKSEPSKKWVKRVQEGLKRNFDENDNRKIPPPPKEKPKKDPSKKRG